MSLAKSRPAFDMANDGTEGGSGGSIATTRASPRTTTSNLPDGHPASYTSSSTHAIPSRPRRLSSTSTAQAKQRRPSSHAHGSSGSVNVNIHPNPQQQAAASSPFSQSLTDGNGFPLIDHATSPPSTPTLNAGGGANNDSISTSASTTSTTKSKQRARSRSLSKTGATRESAVHSMPYHSAFLSSRAASARHAAAAAAAAASNVHSNNGTGTSNDGSGDAFSKYESLLGRSLQTRGTPSSSLMHQHQQHRLRGSAGGDMPKHNGSAATFQDGKEQDEVEDEYGLDIDLGGQEESNSGPTRGRDASTTIATKKAGRKSSSLGRSSTATTTTMTTTTTSSTKGTKAGKSGGNTNLDSNSGADSSSSGGGSGKKAKKQDLLRCERCHKVYHHPQSLIKHRWQHTEIWDSASSYGLSKHQTVQALEAAVILATTPNKTAIDLLPEDKSHWPAAVSPPTSGLLGSDMVNLDVLTKFNSRSLPNPSTLHNIRGGTSLGAILQEEEEEDEEGDLEDRDGHQDSTMATRDADHDDDDDEDDDGTDSADDLLPSMEEDVKSTTNTAGGMLARGQREDTAFHNMDSHMHAMDLNYTRTTSLSPYLHERGLPSIHGALERLPGTNNVPPSDGYLSFQRQVPSSQHSFSRTSAFGGAAAPPPPVFPNFPPPSQSPRNHAENENDADNERSMRETSAVSTDDGTMSGGTTSTSDFAAAGARNGARGVAAGSADKGVDASQLSSVHHGHSHEERGDRVPPAGLQAAPHARVNNQTDASALRNGSNSPAKDRGTMRPPMPHSAVSAPVLGYFEQDTRSPNSAAIIISPRGSETIAPNGTTVPVDLSPLILPTRINGNVQVIGEAHHHRHPTNGYTTAENEAAEILSSSANSQTFSSGNFLPSPVVRPPVHPIVTATGRTLSSSFAPTAPAPSSSYHRSASFGSPQLPSSYTSHRQSFGAAVVTTGTTPSSFSNQQQQQRYQQPSTTPAHIGSFGSPNFASSSFGQAPLSYKSTSLARSFNNPHWTASSSHAQQHNHTAPATVNGEAGASPDAAPLHHQANISSGQVLEEDDDLMDMDL